MQNSEQVNYIVNIWRLDYIFPSYICQVHIMNKIEMNEKWMSKFSINLGIFLSLWTLIWHISVHVAH